MHRKSVLRGDVFGMVPEELVVLGVVGQGSYHCYVFDTVLSVFCALECVTVRGL